MRTFWRLLGFLRPYRRGVIGSFVLAAVAMGAGVLIPSLVGRTVDDIRQRRRRALAARRSRSPAAGVLRLAFSVARRLVAGRVSLGVEFDLRNRMYAHLQSLELGFFDGQQTGQLMSRSTVDLQSVRFFLGYGLIFIAPVGAHDRDRRGGDAGGERRAGAGRAGADAVRGLGRLPLRARATGRRPRRCSSASPS